MKFGKYLEENIHEEWKEYYVDYAGLKKILKEMIGNVQNDRLLTPLNMPVSLPGITRGEARFSEQLEREIEKINAFTKQMSREIRDRAKQWDTLSSKSELSEKLKEDIKQGADECSRLLLQFEKYISLNVTAFVKILKKHDKHRTVKYTQAFIVRIWKQPFLTDKLDDVVVMLSKIHNRLRGPSDQGKKKQGEAAQNFVRKTTKYWVRMEHVTDVKLRILKNLPVLQFKESNSDAQLTSSVYFDNAALELYYGRITKREGAIAFRIRWYGDGDPTDVFMERKTHHDSWAGEISVKTRFTMKEKDVVNYLKGDFKLDGKAEEMRRKGAKEEEVQEMLTLSREIQQVVESKQLVPTVRTVYMRTAFQLPDTAIVRISIDTNLTMILEKCRQDEWRRDPRKEIPESDITRFPFAVLEVKLQLELGEEPPRWVTDLINSGMLIEAHKFSKFIHGCVMLIPDQVPALPHWLDAMDEHLSKKQTSVSQSGSGNQTKTQKRASRNAGQKGYPQGEYVEQTRLLPPNAQATGQGKQRGKGYTRVTFEGSHESSGDDSNRFEASGEESDGFDSQGDSQYHHRHHHQHSGDGSEDGMEDSDYGEPPFDADGHHGDGDNDEGCCSCSTSSFLNIYRPLHSRLSKIPLRIEPKTFYANERTFLTWVNMSLNINMLALGLLNFADDFGMQLAGIILLCAGVVFSIYAYFIFGQRAHRIRARSDGPYDDVFGLGVLVLVANAALVTSLLAAVVFNKAERASA